MKMTAYVIKVKDEKYFQLDSIFKKKFWLVKLLFQATFFESKEVAEGWLRMAGIEFDFTIVQVKIEEVEE